jgi:hypothetical protein
LRQIVTTAGRAHAFLWLLWCNFCALTLGAGATNAQQAATAHWVKLGEQAVVLDVEHASVEIGANENRWRSLRLVARQNSLFIIGITVVYNGGQLKDLVVNTPLPAGGETSPIDLKGEVTFIQRVEVFYRARTKAQPNAVVEVWADGSTEPGNAAWEVLDDQRLDGVSDSVVLAGTRAQIEVTKFAVRALERPVFIRRLQVTDADGRTSNIALRSIISPGEMTEPIELGSDRRYLREVTLYVQPEPREGEHARVQLLGDAAQVQGAQPDTAARDIPQGWVLFRIHTANFAVERDVIALGREIGWFERIALRVTEGDLFIREIRIIYGNGELAALRVDRQFRTGTRTPEIKLDANRFVNEMQLSYAAGAVDRKRVVLELYGDYSDNWRGENGENRTYTAGWELLGAQRSQMVGIDADTFSVGRQFGAFRKLRIVARLAPIEISGVIVKFDSGEVQDLPVRTKLAANAMLPLMELSASDRHIDTIRIMYHTPPKIRGAAAVELWAQH